ncbi:hypothetical protein [Vibrio sonorensis]|uniref:hypothetical protein n=1 Tax=Vibrio sonorensis TaxID=1004316 RepID=UPI0008D9AC7E|nr:hypothetical protein [Vibrio sonorensis]
MEQNEFNQLVNALCETENLPQALEMLRNSENEEVSQAAQSITGQFALAEVEGEKRIYHLVIEKNEQGEDEELVEHVMNEGEDIIRFVAWFFDAQFEVKRKDTYQAAGKTYSQPKRA